jgi:hypothetical protein
MWTIEKRCRQRDTRAFVTADTVDLLGQKMIGIIGDRRMTKMHRYLGEQAGRPRLFPGLRMWHGGFGGPVTLRAAQSASISLASPARMFEGIGFSVGRDDETEQQAAERYHQPKKQWLGQRRDITFVELDGWPGEPGRDDSIRIEYWNDNGVGQETIVVFDDADLIQEIAWTVKGDKEREVHLDNEFCTVHGKHIEDPTHKPAACTLRTATLAEDLALLALLAELRGGQ